ncbi:unnamed protein product [Urochloa decumbens]|uniref:UBC core domain-containing protein n=1 Tax=Urochloa decumbens TaxID=240449 RepID=A0ABC8WE70_9POAL
MMYDATGQRIFRHDLVMFEKTTGAEHDRGLVVSLGKTDIIVVLVDGTEVEKKPCDLTVVDRSFLCPGMAVASVSDCGGQPGVITGVATKLDLVQLDGTDDRPRVVATGVSPAEVWPVRELTRGDYVVSGMWLGRVVEVSVDVDVLFNDGTAVCRVTNAGDNKLRVVSKKSYWNRHKDGFYPGDGVAGDASVLKASRWIKGHWKPSHGEGIVAKVELGGVLVYWATSLQNASSPLPPAYHPNHRNLTFFCPGGTDLRWSWCVSARCYFRSRSPARAPKKKHRTNNNGILIRMAKVKRADRRLTEVKWPMAVANTRTTVNVLWQDGTRQLGVPSASLLGLPLRSQKDFFPGHRVVTKVLSPTPTIADVTNATSRVGVIKSLSSKDQTVCLSWITAAPGEVVDTVMSTYDLARSSDHSFSYGDMVVSLRPRVLSASGNEESNKANNDLAWVGHIADLCDAQYIHVKWGDGTMSKVLLHEIAIVKPRSVVVILREMGDWVSDDEGEDDAFHKKAQGDMPRHRPAPTDNTIGKVCNIFLAVIRTLSGMVVQGKMYMLSKSMASTSSRAEPAMAENIIQTCPHWFEAAAASALASHDAGGDDVVHFKHFDVVQSPRDHHYLDTNEQGGCGGRKWLKRVQKEWKILETSLHDTIYVRGFEDRMDLLRAAMVGASGTPYHDGLFFFDLHLPPSYPAAPPQVKYHSFGLHANPNLYPSGTVCLSLLNTFGGKGTELWSPESSSLLQVVVSIQGLVLTAQPYYNEANYAAQAGTPEGRRNELPYCENTYLVNLHTMLYLIRRPPVGFEMFVRDHFCRRGQHVLRACEAYLHEGCPVGTLDGEAIATETSKDRSCSVGFKLALANVVPRLVEAFTEIGARTSNEVDRM